MSPLTISEMYRSNFAIGIGKPIFAATCGSRGASITDPTIKHKTKLANAVKGLIILGLGISTKSAPLIPDSIETIAKVIIRKTDSIREATKRLDDG